MRGNGRLGMAREALERGVRHLPAPAFHGQRRRIAPDHVGHRRDRPNKTDQHRENPSQEQLRFFSNEWQVNAQAPPAFLLHTQDDFVKVENSLAYYQACLRQGVPAELHLFPRGGHGYGLHHPGGTGSWFGLLLTWLDGISKG